VLAEFSDVIFRKKFDKYFLNDEERHEAVDFIAINALIYSPKITINACRDPKDDKFLELAVTAEASCIITGDQDLLVLHPFDGISILSAMDFLMTF
jgi:putative PIN family toxin of toxin-antitoxin system